MIWNRYQNVTVSYVNNKKCIYIVLIYQLTAYNTDDQNQTVIGQRKAKSQSFQCQWQQNEEEKKWNALCSRPDVSPKGVIVFIDFKAISVRVGVSATDQLLVRVVEQPQLGLELRLVQHVT